MIVPTITLPAPRLEMTWRKTKDREWNWHCDYFLVLALGEHDLRVRKKCRELRVPIGEGTRINRSKPPDWFNGFIDTPFREGAHAKWDSEQLGNLPIYAVYKNAAFRIEPEPRIDEGANQ